MKRKLLSLLVLLIVAATGARADYNYSNYGCFNASMSIGGTTTDFTTWSTNSASPTDLGYVTNLTVTSVAFKIWSYSKNRGGANMYFRIWDGGVSQIGSDQNLWLGDATFIANTDHDYSISWDGTEDLASLVGLTLVHGKTYYVDMWFMTYVNNSDEGKEWYNGTGNNFHAQMTYINPSAEFATGSGGTGWSISPTTAAEGTEVTVSYDGTDGHKVKSVIYSYNDTDTEASGSGNSRTFDMPAYNVEVSTALYYKLSETATDNEANYGSETNVFLERTLLAGGWNTFCAPFAISSPASVFGEGVKVKAFTGSSLSGNTLTLNFTDAATIAAGTPYLIKLPGASSVNLTAAGKEFEGVTQNWIPVNVNPDLGIATFKAVLVPTSLTKDDKTVLFVTGGDKLTYPNNTGNINAFRAYFKLSQSMEALEFRMSFDIDDATGIESIQNSNFKIQNGEDAWYDLSGRKMVNGKLPKGIYIHNGRKEVMK